jgi:hypothetical protein
MKIGHLPRAIADFVKYTQLTKHDLKALLAVGDVMWIGIHSIVTDRRIVIASLRKLKDMGYIKVSRAENRNKGITRMYSITQKGRDTVRKFINTLT